jgi:ribosome-associated translation inhibitor RaiA
MIPLQVVYRNFSSTDSISDTILSHIEQLESIYDRILRCQVIVSAPHRHSQHGRFFHVLIKLHIPGRDIVVTREPERDEGHQNLYVAIRDAFDSAERLLETHVRKLSYKTRNRIKRRIKESSNPAFQMEVEAEAEAV